MTARARVHAMFPLDEAAARELDARLDALVAEEKASATAPTATPGQPTGRVAQLLDAIRTRPGTWTTTKAFEVYRLLPAHAGMPLGQIRSFARGDLRDLAAWGHLTVSEASGRREYRLTTRKDRTS